MVRGTYEEEFYVRGIEENGVDYNVYGHWQRAYGKMIISITDIIKLAADNRDSLLLDVGCACGVTLRAFKETNVFGQCIGVDVSEYMINLGRKTHGFNDDEMMQMDICTDELPVDDDSVTLLHCAHTLEHVTEDDLDFILKEFKRVLKPDGFGLIVVPAIKPGCTAEDIGHEDTHSLIKTMQWWRSKIVKYFKIDNGVRKAFKESQFSPTNDDKTFHHYYNKEWTLFGLRKEK